jgi:O-antigen/teichoic acid export membrane protein
MKKFDKVEILKNVGSSWIALGVNVLVGIFLSPYILHRLGDEAFGIWVLIFSITGYYGLFDLGIRSSIVRYVAKYSATGDHEELNRLINTATFGYAIIGILALMVTISGAIYLTLVFRISASFLSTARLLFLMVGTALSLGFPLGVFGGILQGLQRFYLVNLTSTASALLRCLLIVITLRHGGGLLSVALVTVSLPVIAALVNATHALRLLPLRFGSKYVNRVSLRHIANYSGATFVIMLSWKLRFKTDAIVIGTLLSSAAITYFTVGSRLVDYAGEVVSGLAQIFDPMSSQSVAIGDLTRLRKIVVAGNRVCALIIFPIAAALAILGKSVIEVWVGRRYVATSYPILLVLLIPSTFMLAQAASGRALFGMAKHHTMAGVTFMEGVANVVLSIILVRRFGVLGDAVGTAVPLACTTLFFLPRHLCRVLNLRMRTYLSQAFLLPLALAMPLVAVLVLVRHWFVAHNFFQLAIQLAVASAVYSLELAWAIWTRKAWEVEGIHDAGRETVVELAETYPQGGS